MSDKDVVLSDDVQAQITKLDGIEDLLKKVLELVPRKTADKDGS